VLGLAATLGAALLWYRRTLRKHRIPIEDLWSLTGLTLACLAFWFGLKYGLGFLTEGLSHEAAYTQLLAAYLAFIQVRCELLVLFTFLAAAGVQLYLLTLRDKRSRACWVFLAPLLLALLWGTLLPGISDATARSGALVSPTTDFLGVITPDELQLVAWLDEHVPPEVGDVGLAAYTFRDGFDHQKCHIYPVGGEQAVVLYGRHHNFRFGLPGLESQADVTSYLRHVKERFDAEWCLQNRIHYFFVSQSSLSLNPGLRDALRSGQLKPVKRSKTAGIYQVQVTGLAAAPGPRELHE
jgi:hypothetical protein